MAASLYKHDVFLSFRGEDTRTNFVSHLYEALVESGISTFKDDKKLEKGTSIPDELLKAIDESQFAIVIFSMKYATSSWCLDELVRIIEGKIRRDLTAVPIFYRVNRSEVGEQRKMFAEAFDKHEVNVDREKAQIWRNCLTEVAKLPGWEITQYGDSEAQIIEEIVKYILNKKEVGAAAADSN